MTETRVKPHAKIITQSDQEGSNNPRMKAKVEARRGTQNLTRQRNSKSS